MDDRITYLTEAVSQAMSCDCRHIQTTQIRETGAGLPVWGGTVETFQLLDHPTAKEAFAWMWINEGGASRHVVIPAIPPVLTPQEAVRSVLQSQAAQSHKASPIVE